MTMSIKNLTTNEFEQEILKNEKPVIVDFWAPWCAPCKMIAPVLEELDKEFKGENVEFFKFNIDEEANLAARYGIRSIPTFLLFKNGAIISQQAGALPKDTLRAWIKQNIA